MIADDFRMHRARILDGCRRAMQRINTFRGNVATAGTARVLRLQSHVAVGRRLKLLVAALAAEVKSRPRMHE